ncbi:hypothetical protein PTSG_09652 [Salpingoeca rosetta]|uniref:SMP-30/Gluconolactonase/LRE-like region domain-containing protein n=1 Tax=Salpingoeca rosetta (strain ATCC 50818 / BSB-021) TaxID=946362 RepID=F2ULL5_SALR5|nr:uncharacterized protein PTSG_09652 [Salpingoeca rosetta]EGD78014.1 hypothetical protein PTSG_09652 [Salpingoeca rosetta]|eukprot:XP_004990076.1 hypothetical protein PTSG_09652 [Salpingoeca rosetta]
MMMMMRRVRAASSAAGFGFAGLVLPPLPPLVVVVVVLMALVGADQRAQAEVVFDQDTFGNLHINTSADGAGGGRVLLNGVDVLGLLQQQQERMQAVQARVCQRQTLVDVTGIAVPSGNRKWSDGVLANNGRIYTTPFRSDTVLIIDPSTNSADATTISDLGTDTFKWGGGVLAPNGRIYASPVTAPSVLVIDPETNTVDGTSMPVSGAHEDDEFAFFKWTKGVLAPNGNIYCVPLDAASVLVIDPAAGTADATTIVSGAGTSVISDKWLGAVLADSNGRIYGIPYNADAVLIVDPATNTADNTTIRGFGGMQKKWRGGVLGANGLIYGIPYEATGVLIIDPATNAVDTGAIAGSANLFWQGGVLLHDGRILAFPAFSTPSALIIDPATNTTDTTTVTGFDAVGTAYAGGVLVPATGRVYLIPSRAETIPVINTLCIPS